MATNRYSNAKIYRLVNSVDSEEYVGSTCGKLSKRKSDHKTDAKRKPSRRVYQHLNEVGWDNVDIVLVEEYPCENKNQLERRERHWIETLKPSLNMYVPTRTLQEYNADNASKFSEIKAKYYADNAENIRERVAKYYAENATKVREYQKKYNTENADKVRERQAKYREANREVIQARDRERYAKKKAEREAST